jgi:hypothetical protein
MMPSWSSTLEGGDRVTDEAGFASGVVETRRRVKAIDRLAGQLDGQIVVLGRWESGPSTLRDALATIVHVMQNTVRGLAPAVLLPLLVQVGGDRDPITILDLARQLL